MTTLTIDLPDNIAKDARDAGLLSPDALAKLLQDTMRLRAGHQLLNMAERIQAGGVPPLSNEGILAEVKAVRAERRIRQAKADNANRP